jgi:hypothetical protein
MPQASMSWGREDFVLANELRGYVARDRGYVVRDIA